MTTILTGTGRSNTFPPALEGGMIFLAGTVIIGKSIYGFFEPPLLKSLDTGTWIAGIAGACNYIMGSILVRIGKKHNSILMVADGKHLDLRHRFQHRIDCRIDCDSIDRPAVAG